MIWTPEKVALLLTLHTAGHSFQACGRQIGCSRSAAAAKWCRLHGRHLEGGHGPRRSRRRTDTFVSHPKRWTEEALTRRWADRNTRSTDQ